MNYWIIPANPKLYRITEVLNDKKFVDWTQRNKFQVDDIVYIYSSSPDSRILYKMKVTAINLSAEEAAEDKEYWVNPKSYYASKEHNKFYRMVVLAENTTSKLTIKDLKEHGLKSDLQGPMRPKDVLLNYIKQTL